MLIVQIGSAVLSKIGLSGGAGGKKKRRVKKASSALPVDADATTSADGTAADTVPAAKPTRKPRMKIRKVSDYTTRESGYTKKRVKKEPTDPLTKVKELVKKIDLSALTDLQNQNIVNKIKTGISDFKFGKS
jgi:hypothetical protein